MFICKDTVNNNTSDICAWRDDKNTTTTMDSKTMYTQTGCHHQQPSGMARNVRRSVIGCLKQWFDLACLRWSTSQEGRDRAKTWISLEAKVCETNVVHIDLLHKRVEKYFLLENNFSEFDVRINPGRWRSYTVNMQVLLEFRRWSCYTKYAGAAWWLMIRCWWWRTNRVGN